MIDALTPKAALKIESADTRVDARWENILFLFSRQYCYIRPVDMFAYEIHAFTRMLKDERTRQQDHETVFDIKELDTKIG